MEVAIVLHSISDERLHSELLVQWNQRALSSSSPSFYICIFHSGNCQCVCVWVSIFFFSSSSSFVLVARRLLFKQSFRGETPNLYSSSSFKKKIVSFFFKKKFKAPDWKGKPTNAPDSKSFSKSQDFTLVPRNIILRDDNLLRESPTRWNLFPWFSLSPGSYLIIFDLFFSLFFCARRELNGIRRRLTGKCVSSKANQR